MGFLVLASLSFVLAAQDRDGIVSGREDSEISSPRIGADFEPMEQRVRLNSEITPGQIREIQLERAQMRIQRLEGELNRIRLRVNNISAECDCDLSEERIQNRTRLMVNLSNGRNAEVKVMPDVASVRALERLRLKNCNESNNCSIELKEVGQNSEERVLAYEARLERKAKFLGLFERRMEVRAQVDAETGEVIAVKKPWWAFLASEPAETEDAE